MAIERMPFDLRIPDEPGCGAFEPEAERAKLRFTHSVAADVPSC